MFGFRRWKLLRTARNGVARLLSLTVTEAMTDYVVTISPEKNVIEAANIMVGEDISTLVVEENGKALGVLTERDFIKKVPATAKVFSLTVRDVMTPPAETVAPGTTVREAIAHLKQRHIRKLVVTTQDGRLTGIITQTDLSRKLYECLPVIVKLPDLPFLVKDVMSNPVISIPAGASFAAAKDLMTKKNISAVLVTNGKEHVGIFTEYDVVMQFYDAGGKLDVRAIPEVMKGPIKAIPADLSIFDANMIMLFEKIRRLLVIEDRKVVGIVTQTDLVHACYDYAEKLSEHLREHSLDVREEDLIQGHRRENIVSQYASEHLRAYTVR
jgi:CBS domain-containing protein